MRLVDGHNTDQQTPKKQSFCESLRLDTHWKCLILSLLINGCLAAIVWCRLTKVDHVMSSVYEDLPFYRSRSDPSSPCEDGYVYIPVAFVVMLYLVYLVECWHCHTRIQLQSKVHISTVYDRIQGMKDSLPIVWWKATCYHYVRRTRQVTRYRNGDAFTTTQVYYERINSHAASSAFNFTTCGVKDVSKTLVNLETFPATKIKFSKGFSFTVIDAEQEYEDQRAQFFQEHERRDDYMETREGLDLMNTHFKDYMIGFADPDHLPWYVSQLVFWLASFLLLSWPLRVLIEYKTAYVHYHVHKLFGTNYIDTSSNTTNHISRVSTMASVDFEMNIQNNYSMVPSYSEAILMDSGHSSRRDANGNLTPGHTPSSYTPLNVYNYNKLYSSSRTLSANHIASSVSGQALSSGLGAPRVRSVILRIPQNVNSRLRRKRKQRRHSVAEMVPLNELRPQDSSRVLQCSQSVSMLGAVSRGSSLSALSDPHITPTSHFLSREAINEANGTVARRPMDSTILEVDSEHSSPLPGQRSMISSGQVSPPGSSGSNTPLLGHGSPARRHTHQSPVRQHNLVFDEDSSSSLSSLRQHRVESHASMLPLLHHTQRRGYHTCDESVRGEGHTSAQLKLTPTIDKRMGRGKDKAVPPVFSNEASSNYNFFPDGDEVTNVASKHCQYCGNSGVLPSSISGGCHCDQLPNSPPTYEEALDMRVAVTGEYCDVDPALRMMETAL